jgi:uncharacterized protein YndB with AHSA1/START domain
MPRVIRKRTISAGPRDVWGLVSDPYNLPRWWPRVTRVENVEPAGEAGGAEWTKVLETAEGRGVRADYRCVASDEGRRYAWEQQPEGTPFERHLRRSSVEIELRPDGDGAEVSLSYSQSLRGLSRLGAPMMRRGQAATLDEALDGIERALGGAAK